MSARLLRIGALTVLGASLSLCAGPRLSADVLHLQNGRDLTGDVTVNDTEYTVKTRGGTVKVPISDVARWEKSAPAATPGAPAPGPAAGIPLGGGSGIPGGSELAKSSLTPPAAAPSEASARANRSIAEAAAAYKAANLPAAMENFLDAYQVLEGNGVHVDPNNPAHYTMLAGLGACFMAAGTPERANTYIEKAASSKLHERSVMINRAILDYTQHTSTLRGVKDLTIMLAPIGSDVGSHEFEINLLGASIDYLRRDERNFNNRIFKDGSDLHEHLQHMLDVQHPHEVFLAGRWLSREEGKSAVKRFVTSYTAWKASLAARDVASARASAAEAEYTRLKSVLLASGNAVDRRRAEAAHAASVQASSDYNAIKEEPPKLYKAIEWPQWPPFPPVQPDFSNATALDTGAAASSKFAINRYSVAVPVGPDAVLTSAAILVDATDIQLTDSSGVVRTGRVLRKDGLSGLALIKVEGKPLKYLSLASNFTGGELSYWGFPTVPVGNPIPAAVAATAPPVRNATWSISTRQNPRLPGAAIVDRAGGLLGITLSDRISPSALLPAVPCDQIRAFLNQDRPAAAGTASILDVLELRASH